MASRKSLLRVTRCSLIFFFFGCHSDVMKSEVDQKETATVVLSEISTESQSETPRTGVVVLELFTSQGCSSCPPADENVMRVDQTAREQNLPVYPLSFHVDYWNRLGWTDPFSSAEATERQRGYARAFGSGRIYTPQLVINGTTEFVGSSQKRTEDVLRQELGRESTTMVAATAQLESGKIQVRAELKSVESDRRIHAALVKKEATSDVTRGENANRKLQHRNVVRQFQSQEAFPGEHLFRFAIPGKFVPADYEVVVYVQVSGNGRIEGATRLALSGE